MTVTPGDRAAVRDALSALNALNGALDALAVRGISMKLLPRPLSPHGFIAEDIIKTESARVIP